MSARSSIQGPRSRAASPQPSLVAAEDLHVEHVELPARRASVEARHGPAPVEGMHPVHPSQPVPRGTRIVRDKNSGQHYAQPPEGVKGFSLSRAKNAPRLAQRDWHVSGGVRCSGRGPGEISTAEAVELQSGG
jgi:hypothetical protein